MARQIVTKEKVIARLIKWGWNEESAKGIVTDKGWEYIQRYYSDATVSEVADILSIIEIEKQGGVTITGPFYDKKEAL